MSFPRLLTFRKDFLNDEESVIFRFSMTLVTQILGFCAGQHKKLTEPPDIVKQVLAGILLLHETLQTNSNDALA